jgi:hypothetical protein
MLRSKRLRCTAGIFCWPAPPGRAPHRRGNEAVSARRRVS